VEFTARHFTFFRIEIGGDSVYAIGIADHDDLVGELFRFQMEVEATAIGIDNKFRRSDHLIYDFIFMISDLCVDNKS